ncbi:MAG: NAD(P)H-dependent oxidoreductase subunit E [Thermoguttaceae bacterium]
MQTTQSRPTESPTKPFLSQEMCSAIEALYPRYPSRQAIVLPALHIVNERKGYVPLEAVVEIAQMLGLAPAQVQDTLSFYQFFPQDKPSGKFKVWMCRSISCSCCEGEVLMDYLAQKLGIHPGETTNDGRVTLLPAECLGACDFAPAMLVNDTLYKTMTREKIDAFVEMFQSLTPDT